jgi:hypothetical protein
MIVPYTLHPTRNELVSKLTKNLGFGALFQITFLFWYGLMRTGVKQDSCAYLTHFLL